MTNALPNGLNRAAINRLHSWRDADFGLPPEQFAAAEARIASLLDMLHALPPASSTVRRQTSRRNRRLVEMSRVPRLFGTSGLRAQIDLDSDIADVIELLVEENKLTLLLGYFHARSFGYYLRTKRPQPFHHRVFLNLDPRRSSPLVAVSIAAGLRHEGLEVYCNGIASTPAALLFNGEPAIVVTASHNSALFNGIKAYLAHQPISFETEAEVEASIRTHNDLLLAGYCLAPAARAGALFDSSRAAEQRYDKSARRRYRDEGLFGPESTSGQEQTPAKIVLDLAHGTAASVIDLEGCRNRLSALLRLHLDMGLAVIAYAGEIDQDAINEGAGAAFMYGETGHPCPREQIIACAEGRPGYGLVNRRQADGSFALAPAPRSLYLPGDWNFKTESLKEWALRVDGHWLFKGIDAPRWDSVRTSLEAEVAELPMLTGVSVDCDVDRITNFSPAAARTYDIPFLSGDAYLAIFCLFLRERLTKVFFTVESSLFLEKFCTYFGVPYDVVTVGDRALAMALFQTAEALAASGRRDFKLVGAEASGHVMFLESKGGERSFFDDPVITDAILKSIIRKQRLDLQQLIAAVYAVYPEIVCVRKPEAWIINDPSDPEHWTPSPVQAVREGLSLVEKELLLLRNRSAKTVELTEYAIDFIRFYVERWARAYATAFYADRQSQTVVSLPGLAALIAAKLQPPEHGYRFWDLGVISWSAGAGRDNERIEIRLRLTNDACYGPQDITLEFGNYFRLEDDLDLRFFVVGRGTFRNSGTSQKASGYHNLDRINFPLLQAHFGVHATPTPVLKSFTYQNLQRLLQSPSSPSNGVIERLLTRLAIERATFTNTWIKSRRS